jgi:hypothetical protein
LSEAQARTSFDQQRDGAKDGSEVTERALQGKNGREQEVEREREREREREGSLRTVELRRAARFKGAAT